MNIFGVGTIHEFDIVMQHSLPSHQWPALVVLPQGEFVLPSGSVLFFPQFDLDLDVWILAGGKTTNRAHTATPPYRFLKPAAR